MALEQYIVRELKADIKLLINKVTELEQKIAELKPNRLDLLLKPIQDAHTESEKMQDELEPIVTAPMMDKE